MTETYTDSITHCAYAQHCATKTKNSGIVSNSARLGICFFAMYYFLEMQDSSFPKPVLYPAPGSHLLC